MRILTALPKLDARGGVELHLLQVLRELAARGHDIHLCYEEDGNLSDEFGSFCASMSQGAPVMYGRRPSRQEVRELAARAWSTSRIRPDLVYANHFTELVWAHLASQLSGAKVVCHLHEFSPFRRISLVALGAGVKRFIVSSGFSRATWTQHGLNRTRIATIPCGIRLSDYPRGSEADLRSRREALGIPHDAYVVAYIGRIIPEKGADVLVDAWHRLGLSADGARLVLAGVPSGTADEYLDGLRRSAPPGCKWLPMQRDVVSVMHAADVVVLPSRWDEPFGRVIIETMATGRPVVAASVGGIPEILDGEFSRFRFERGDAAALADRLHQLRQWRHEDPGLADRCVDHVARRYEFAEVTDQIEAVFQAAVGSNR